MGELLPNAAKAHIDPRKLRDYALILGHDTGQNKAAFFGQMGYVASDWQCLERDIREQHLNQPADKGVFSPYGQKFAITAPLQGPTGEARWVTSVWLVRLGNDWADLVTIEPARRR